MKGWNLHWRNRPWFVLPVPAEWKRQGDTTVVTRYEHHRVNIYDLPSAEIISDAEWEIMDEFDAEEQKAIEEAGGGDA